MGKYTTRPDRKRSTAVWLLQLAWFYLWHGWHRVQVYSILKPDHPMPNGGIVMKVGWKCNMCTTDNLVGVVVVFEEKRNG